ncbi:MAG: hypothetical protein ABIH36_03400 [bacterium]
MPSENDQIKCVAARGREPERLPLPPAEDADYDRWIEEAEAWRKARKEAQLDQLSS